MIDRLTQRKQINKMEEKKENKIAALLRKPDAMEQTAVQVVSQNNLSSDKITETKSEVGMEGTEELATRVSGVEALIPKIDIKIGKVSKKVDNLKGSTNRKFERITKEIDIIAEGIDDNNKRVTKLSALIQKNKKDSDKDSKKSEKGNNKIITILTNMLDFMKLTFEQDNLARDQRNNFSEEQKAENDRKDKELLEALKALNGRDVPTAEKIDEEGKKSFLEKILGAMASILGPLKTFMSVIGKLFTTISKIFTSLTRFIGFAGRLLFTVGRFFLMNPVGIALLAAVSLAALLATDKKPEETSKGIINAGSTDGGMAEAIMQTTEVSDENAVERKKQNILADRPSEKKSLLPWKDSDLQKSYLQEVGWDEKSGTTKKERDSGAIKIDSSGNLVMKIETPAATFNAAKDSQSANVTPDTPATPSTTGSSEEGMKNYKGRGPATTVTPSAPAPADTPAPKEVPAPVSSATPMMDTPNLGTQMATMSNENALAKTVEELAVATSSQVNNVIASTKSVVEHTNDKIPSVRNQEDTFQRMILNSTRVV